MTTVTDDQFDREFKEYWDNGMLEYPTITRNEAGEWEHFDVEPGANGVELALQTGIGC
jgi:hypothetical protein